MKKWIAAVCGLLLVWNSWLTYRLVTTSSPKENDNNPSTIDEEQIIDYTTDVTALVESVQSSIVSISTRSKGRISRPRSFSTTKWRSAPRAYPCPEPPWWSCANGQCHAPARSRRRRASHPSGCGPGSAFPP